ncbi:MAG: hypothetical protein MRJ65_07855 [Candidatus Brocadiaceae bacterium]|nr:hypothetical protein [Candidatus Brocadiaceae bacterium]
MIKRNFLYMSMCIFSFVGFSYFVSPFSILPIHAETVEHDEVDEPTKKLMQKIEVRLKNILDGILGGSLQYVAQEASSIIDQSYKINETFFTFDPNENKWFKRAGIKPDDRTTIESLKEEFSIYQNGIVYLALQLRQKALSGNREETFHAFTTMIEKTCFECHERNRNKLLFQPGSHGPGR